VLAFLKRRWVLLSCAVVLLACSVVDVRYGEYFVDSFARRYFDGKECVVRVSAYEFGTYLGNFRFFSGSGIVPELEELDELVPSLPLPDYEPGTPIPVPKLSAMLSREVHSPQLGTLPAFVRGGDSLPTVVYIPLWLPLSVILGWLVIRELRWREKRAKSADA
jgi:hypothetical protein